MISFKEYDINLAKSFLLAWWTYRIIFNLHSLTNFFHVSYRYFTFSDYRLHSKHVFNASSTFGWFYYLLSVLSVYAIQNAFKVYRQRSSFTLLLLDFAAIFRELNSVSIKFSFQFLWIVANNILYYLLFLYTFFVVVTNIV